MGRYIHWGLEQAGHKVYSCGPWSRGKIPWGDFQYPNEYWFAPDIETPDTPEIKASDLFDTLKRNGIKVDLFIQAADNYFVSGRAPVKTILIGTDPHVVDYSSYIKDVDLYVSMQDCYANGAYWMPYGYDPKIHVYKKKVIEFDVVFIGLQYEHRKDVLRKLSDLGLRVYCGLGDIYKEYVDIYNKGIMAFNWSSREDLPARFWEGLAMKRLVVTNRVPDLRHLPFKDGIDYVGFSSMDEAVEKIIYYCERPDRASKIAASGNRKVQPHTYKNHLIEMLKQI